ncbi:MAG: Hsp33 family molecular chaperone HslO [Erysipelotrichaceae bacterium]|nr:Hsp33 family molecular chaperone HslO [Erysipelotrichaceae bacterium]MDO5108296.1 Hsp33 family molecular chaperone HslO [Erysipelotrichaceae bacterium]
MKDIIVIAQALGGQVRIHAARTTALVEESRKAHQCMATSAAALGRVLSATAIMASDLKNPQEKITSIMNGHGPAGTVLAQADGAGNVRGFISDPNLYIVREDGHLAVGQAIGRNGTLSVIKDLGLKEPFTGVAQIQSGEVGDDYAYYFAISEQTPSIVGVGVLVNPDSTIQAAGGIFIQLMPGASEEAIEKCEKVAAALRPVSSLIDEGLEPADIVRMYFEDAEIIGERDVRWYCSCSRERFAGALKTLQVKDLQEMIDDGKGAEIRCEYCNTYYRFTPAEVRELLEEKRAENRPA